jgi:branched-chain amino acid transport system ATP-binding protein
MEHPVLQLIDVKKSFGALPIIRGVNLEVARGERHALIGPNGAGKSTLFNLISGLFQPSSGEIRLDGLTISGKAPHQINRLGLARSFQITNIFPRLSVFENVRIGILARHGVRYGLNRRASAMRQVTDETIALVEKVRLGRRVNTAAGDLAYSEQRALEIGMTLATEPAVILLDEPTAGMSRDETAYVVELVREVTVGRTLLVVEHDMDVVFGLCDQVSVLVYGVILASGAPDEVRHNADVQAAYLGEEETQ